MDFDGDGDADVLSGSWPGELYFFSRTEDGSFAAGEKIQNAEDEVINTGNASTVFAVDWDGDGDLDLITGNISGEVHLLSNDGSRTAPAYGKPVKLQVDADLKGRGGDSGAVVADWDADGLADLLVAMGNGSVVWFRNTGRPGAPELAQGEELIPESPFGFDLKNARPDEGQWGARVKIHPIDFDGDGRLDLLLGDRSGAPANAVELSDDELQEAASARERVLELREQIAKARLEIANREPDGDEKPSNPAELTKARKEYERLIEESARQLAIVNRAESKPLRHGFVWLFGRRPASEVAQN